ncbi:MAG: aminoacyl-tRNA hydrolase [Acidobacteriota bacterium]
MATGDSGESPADPRPSLKVILGLGNPGERYVETRHNVGFRVIEELARRRGLTLEALECNCLGAGAPGLLLAAPQTFMNRSGFTARCLRERHGLEAENFLIVYDEARLPLGTLRLRTQGSPAGHRGMESVLENLGTDRVARLRLGVGPEGAELPGGELVDFVLGDFESEQRDEVSRMVERAAEACETWADEGSQQAMQRWNGAPPVAEAG